MYFFRLFLGIFVGLILGVSPLFAPPEWKAERFVELEKDEFYVLTLQANDAQKTLFFRWTLLKNEGLVVHLNYDSFPHQFILYQDYQRTCYEIPLLKADQRYYTREPFFMLCFKDYHRTKKIATLKFYIYEGSRDFNIIDERKVPNGGFNAY
ncbi:hypothetical protein LS70_007375 [Helicobacter sp. MIT 11-5569]|uniref:hypothetical protein n=1 Tax=Helicobacter sp. MIT 11-5569 TaxID=1548151 RepID=UPI00068A9F50|nr:hypothetical protein [Helicobacter sp. MIT 11-5569]TLD82416.1 hypothetical protein LS70_007375 [Helicobacter sp. MIT 11-5569]